MKPIILAACLLTAVAWMAPAQSPSPDPLTVTLPSGRVVHFETAEQKAKFEAAQQRRQEAAAAATPTPPHIPALMGQTALDTHTTTQAVASTPGGLMLDEAAQPRTTLLGRVAQIVPGGLLVRHGERVVLLQGYPQEGTIVEYARVSVIASMVGSYEYSTVNGSSSRVARYKYISGTVTNPR